MNVNILEWNETLSEMIKLQKNIYSMILFMKLKLSKMEQYMVEGWIYMWKNYKEKQWIIQNLQ